MSDVKYYHVTNKGLQEGESLGWISVVLKADYDALKAELLQEREVSKAYIASDGERSLREHALQSDLTKARELLASLIANRDVSDNISNSERAMVRVFLAHQCRTAANPCGALSLNNIVCSEPKGHDGPCGYAPAAKCNHSRKHHEHGGTQLRCSDCGEACGPAAKE